MRKYLAFITLIANSINIFDCAKESGSLGRIVRGQDAAIGQFPYAVRLSIKTRGGCPACVACIPAETCGGALISPTWILTAAHCVADTQSVKVYLGSISKNRAKIVYDVPNTQIKIHPRFNSRNGYNDIALLKIPYTKLCKEIGIVSLPKFRSHRSQPKYTWHNATACGWGLTSNRGDFPINLQWGRLQILPLPECKHLRIIQSQICTIISPDFATINYGDSGGPLVLETTKEIVGIVSAGDARNCESGYPAIFTRVTSYLNWIKSVSGISH